MAWSGFLDQLVEFGESKEDCSQVDLDQETMEACSINEVRKKQMEPTVSRELMDSEPLLLAATLCLFMEWQSELLTLLQSTLQLW